MVKLLALALSISIISTAAFAQIACEDRLIRDSLAQSRDFASDFLIARYERDVKTSGKRPPSPHLGANRIGIDNDRIAAQEMEARFGLRVSQQDVNNYVRHSLSEASAQAYADCIIDAAAGFKVVPVHARNDVVSIKAVWRPEGSPEGQRPVLEIQDMYNSEILSPAKSELAPGVPVSATIRRINRDRDAVISVGMSGGAVTVVNVKPSFVYASQERSSLKTASKRAHARFSGSVSESECVTADEGYFFDLSVEPAFETIASQDFGGAVHASQKARIDSKDRYQICFTVTAQPSTKSGSEIEVRLTAKQFQMAISRRSE